MKTIILAGGLGTRISEETENKPKPMVMIGNQPILYHVMEIFHSQGFNDFVLALGYKSEVIKRWLLELNSLSGDIFINSSSGKETTKNQGPKIDFNVHAMETGLSTKTGGRLLQCLSRYPGETMMATYGDGLANVNISKLLDFHASHGKLLTITAVRPPSRFGHLNIDGHHVVSFTEKEQLDTGWINGGFFVIDSKVRDLFMHEDESFEFDTIPNLVNSQEVMAYLHEGFWHPMDTLRDKNRLMELSHIAEGEVLPWLRFKA